MLATFSLSSNTAKPAAHQPKIAGLPLRLKLARGLWGILRTSKQLDSLMDFPLWEFTICFRYVSLDVEFLSPRSAGVL